MAKIETLKNLEIGKRAFILGNGPSVKLHDLAKLKGEVVIGMNASILLEKEYGFSSKYYTISDQRFIERPEKLALSAELAADAKRIIRADLKSFDCEDYKERSYYIKPLERDGFSRNLAVGFCFGSTTAMLALQLAYYLGVSEVYLLGVDLRYDPNQPRFYNDENPLPVDSLTSVQVWNIAKAAKLFGEESKKLYSCSSESLLRPYVKFAEFDLIFKGGK